MRALTAALFDWVTKGAEPPPSRYPRLDRNELGAATKAGMAFPNIPGVPSPDGLVNPVFDYDFGPDFNYNDESGLITKQPPAIRQTLPTLVPKVDADGNDLGGVPSVQFQVPLGTYLGWNITAAGFDKGKICTLNGSLRPIRQDQSGSHGVARSAPIARGAVWQPPGVRGCCQSGGGQGSGRSIPAARRCRPPDRGGLGERRPRGSQVRRSS